MSTGKRPSFRAVSPNTIAAMLVGFGLLLGPSALQGQTDSNAQTSSSTAQGSGGQKQQAPPEAGGPQTDTGPYAIPKKKEDNAPPPPPQPKAPEGMPNYSINVEVPLVQLDALVLTKDGHFIPGLQKDHFRILEDGVPQKIQSFSVTQAPFTAVLLVEFAADRAFERSKVAFLYDALRASYAFTDQMQKNDYVAVMQYDMKTNILVDFTSDKQAVYGALNTLRIPMYSETNLYDALYDTLDRLDRIEGRKEIILVGSGVDTFSKMTYDKVMKKIKATPNVTIFPISTGFLWRQYLEVAASRSMEANMRNMDYIQADNQMNTFAKLSGGRWFQPRFQGELPEIFHEIAASVRNQYSLAYRPTNTKQDGSYRKLKIELVQPGTDKPLIVKDQKGKDVKFQIIAREGYTAKHTVE